MFYSIPDNEFKGFYMNIPLSHISEDSTIFSKTESAIKNNPNVLFQPLDETDSSVLPEQASLRTRNTKNLNAIIEYYQSWRTWQQKILLVGIVNRYSNYLQLWYINTHYI